MKECGMPIDGVQLAIHRAAVPAGAQRLCHLPLLPDGEEHVVLHPHHQSRLGGPCKAGGEAGLSVLPRLLQAEAVDRPGDPQHRVRVVVLVPCLALHREVALNLELVAQSIKGRRLDPPLAEALLPLVARAVGDGSDLAREAESRAWGVASIVVATSPVRVGHDGLPLNMPQCDAAGKRPGATRDADKAPNTLGVVGGRAYCVHAAQGSTDASMNSRYTEMVHQCKLCGHHVLHLKPGEAAAVPPPVRGINGRWPSGAVATAQVIGADHVEEVCVKRPSRADEVLPPPACPVPAVRTRMRGDGAAAMEQHDVVTALVQLAPRLVGEPELWQLASASQSEGLAEVEDVATRRSHARGALLLRQHGRPSSALWQSPPKRGSSPWPSRRDGSGGGGRRAGRGWTHREMALHCRADGLPVVEEGGMPVDGVQLAVGDALVSSGTQGLHQLPLLPHREKHVACDPHDERRLHCRPQACREAGLASMAGLLHGEAINGLGDPDHGVGVVVLLADLALTDQVPLDLKLVVHAPRGETPPLAEALLPLLAGAVRDGAHLPREPQARQRRIPVIVVAVVPIGVGHDGLALHVPKGDASREGLRKAEMLTNRATLSGYEAAAQRLCMPPSDAPTQAVDAVNAQVVEERELRCNHVLHLEAREAAAVPAPSPRIQRRRPAGPVAAAEVVGAYHMEDISVQWPARTDKVLPPASRPVA
eukprot:CAMPEP_0171160292 /NCGR_PEP_ID=MMETSP0790-20130122/3478_1 /TAXON_ID=2925 /ORGANISM="Alexandrium catenella, Strain OF101" /LENGTH=705 /DNA_ID=CAMNT_0011624813 /DNA_START=17 /DNA_END=2132 /DNA_ORIENTATION=+